MGECPHGPGFAGESWIEQDSYGLWCTQCPARWIRVGGRLDNLREQHASDMGELELERQKTAEALALAREENKRLREALKECARAFEQTHSNFCSPAWTDRDLHAPECLLYEAEDARRALASDEGSGT